MKLFHYYNREILHLMLGMMMVLLVIMVSVTFVKYLAMAANGEMPLKSAIALLGIVLPSFISMLLPISLFLSLVVGMGRLLRDNELTIGFACGMSWTQLLMRFLRLGVGAALVTALLTFFVVPKMNYYQGNLSQINSQNASILNFVQSGRFFVPGGNGNQVIYVGNIDFKSRQSKDIFIYQQSHGATQVVIAPTGSVTEQGTELASVNLQNGQEYQGVLGSLAYRLVSFDSLSMILIPSYNLANRDLSAISSLQLWKQHDPASLIELEWRSVLPVTTLVLVFLAVGLGDLEPRRGRYIKIFYAIGLFIAYFNAESVVKSMMLSQRIPVFPGLFWVHGVFLLLGIFLILCREGYFNVFLRLGVK
ncbi:MAG: LPS export ABC transporter permease LptF [Gammaproteobacteria bacterium]|nr:LPS export ABC transporter permease LptF [Gammaproteobacteria bacterium]